MFEVESNANIDYDNVRENMLNYLCTRNDVHFKSQQRGEPDLSDVEKREIAESILNRSFSSFLSRFGNYILEEHLIYFKIPPENERYEVEYYTSKLKKSGCKQVTETQIKNRRFEALKRLLSGGEYFSVNEMRKRNPLLYDQLLGQFMKDKELVDNSKPTTIANILLDQMEEDNVDKLKRDQEEMEKRMLASESISSDDDESTAVKLKRKIEPVSKKDFTQSLWGEHAVGTDEQKDNTISKSRWKRKNAKSNSEKTKTVYSEQEKFLLINEFTSAMFTSFLRGKDDYNYSEIDNNSEYDDIAQYDIDEEEKYFDTESPEENGFPFQQTEDELDAFMKDIDNSTNAESLASALKTLGTR